MAQEVVSLEPYQEPTKWVADRYGDGRPFECTEEGWPLCPEGYTDLDASTGARVFRGPEVGVGAFARVMQTKCVRKDPSNEEHGGEQLLVAVKCLRLENITTSLEEIQTEVRTMKMNKHPNVLALHCCFVVGSELWMIMPLMNKGSCHYAMRKLSPKGIKDEGLLALILFDLLSGLQYVHANTQIHRDIKAGNLLMGLETVESADDPTKSALHAPPQRTCYVKIADFGVAGWFKKADATSREGGGGGGFSGTTALEDIRTTFVGTPCWMAPEVMASRQTQSSYNEMADIWSVGITALELAKGHAPYSKFSPIQVITKTVEDGPPGLHCYESQEGFSPAFKKFVARCLVKDPLLR